MFKLLCHPDFIVYVVWGTNRISFFPSMDKLLFPHYLLNNWSPVTHTSNALQCQRVSLHISWIPLWAHCSFLWSICVSLFQYYVVLYAHIYQYCYFSGQSPSTPSQMHTLFLFLKSILIIPGPLPTHVSFGVRLLRSKINFWDIGWNCIEFGDSWHLWCWVLLYMNILYLSGSLGLL